MAGRMARPLHVVDVSAKPVSMRSSVLWGPATVARVSRGIAHGNEAAFNEFYHHYYGRLYRYAWVLSRGDEEMAREILQEAMLRVVRYLKTVASEGILWSWLTRVLRSAFIDWIRRERRHGHAPVHRESEETAGDEGTELLVGLLDEALEDLSPDDRRLLRERHMEGRPIVEMAEQRASTVKAVQSRLARLRLRVKERLLEKLRRE